MQLREDKIEQQKIAQYDRLVNDKIAETINKIDSLDENSPIEELEEILQMGKFCGAVHKRGILRELEKTADKSFKTDIRNAIEISEKFEMLERKIIDKFSIKLKEIDAKNLDFEQTDIILSHWDEISKLCDIKELDTKRKSVSQVIEQKIDKKIKLLDVELESLRGNSNQEEKINEIQNLIERIEDRYLEFKTKVEYNRTIERWENKKAETLKMYGRYTEKPTVSPIAGIRYEKWYIGTPASEGMVRDELQRNVLNHKQQRLKEEARTKAEQEAREKAEEQARLKAEQEARERAEEQARLKAEQEAREKAEEQARLKAEQEARERAKEQARLKAEQEAKQKAEEQARLKAEQEAKQKAEEQARLKAEQEARERAEEQARLKAEQAARDKKEQNIAQAQTNDYEELMGNKERNKVYGILGTLESERTKENEGKASADIWLHRYSKWYNVIDKIPENQKSKYMLIQEDVVKLVENMIKERAQQKEEHIQTQDENER